MKKAILVTITLALFISAENASAKSTPVKDSSAVSESPDNSLTTGKYGLTVSTSSNTMITGKYFIANDTAILGGFGLTQVGNGGGTSEYLMGGVRKYKISQDKSDDFFPFIGGRAWYSTSANTTSLGFSAEAGAEYFLAKHFSLEGSATVGYGSTTPSGGTATSTLGTSVYALGANFYF